MSDEEFVGNWKFYLDNDITNKDSMMGWNPSGEQPEYAIVLPAPTPHRVNTTNHPVGQASVDLIDVVYKRVMPDRGLPKVYWTFLVPTPVAFKKKPPIAKIRENLPNLLKELRLVLTGTTQSYLINKKELIACPYCDSTQVIGASSCTKCAAPLGNVRPYYVSVEELAVPRKRRILVQGKEVAKQLCPSFTNMTADHGALFYNPDLDAIVVPTYEFWNIRYDKTKQAVIERDLERFFTLPDPVEPDYQVTNHFDDAQFDQPLVLDIETAGLEPFIHDITMVGYKRLEVDEPVTIVKDFTTNDLVHFLLKAEESGQKIICHNTQFDVHFMYHKAGLSEVKLSLVDTMLMAFVLGEVPLNLKHLTSKYTDRPGPHAFGGIEDYGYLAEDVLSTEELYLYLSKIENPDTAINLLHNILPYMVEMRLNGVHIDLEKFEALKPVFDENIQEALKPLEARMLNQNLDDLNFNSSKQVAGFLLAEGVRLTEKTASGNYSVSEPVLQSMAGRYPVIDELLNYRFHSKQKTFLESYSEFLQYDGYLHPRMKLHGTETGRLSCTDPNLQQVPRVGPIKTFFTSRWPGGFIGLVDLAQAELRVLALLANDEAFAEALIAEDVHRKIASMILGIPEHEVTTPQRKASKAITFGIIYGGSDRGLAARAGLGIQQVAHVRSQFLSTFPGVNNFLEVTKSDALRTGWVTSPLGRNRDIGRILLLENEHGAGRKAINTPIQGTASDIMLYVNYHGTKLLKEHQARSRFIFGVHDSNLLDIHPQERKLTAYAVQQGFRALENTPLADFPLWDKLPIPGELVIAESWAHTESTNEAYNPESVEIYQCSTHPTDYEVTLDHVDMRQTETADGRKFWSAW